MHEGPPRWPLVREGSLDIVDAAQMVEDKSSKRKFQRNSIFVPLGPSKGYERFDFDEVMVAGKQRLAITKFTQHGPMTRHEEFRSIVQPDGGMLNYGLVKPDDLPMEWRRAMQTYRHKRTTCQPIWLATALASGLMLGADFVGLHGAGTVIGIMCLCYLLGFLVWSRRMVLVPEKPQLTTDSGHAYR